MWDWWPETDDDLPPAVWPWRPEQGPKRKKTHYGTYPLWLPLRCVRLATSAMGCCPRCSAPWRRVVERTKGAEESVTRPRHAAGLASDRSTLSLSGHAGAGWAERGSKVATLGWQQGCKCPPSDPVPARVLDPFAGTATTGVAARLLGRTFVGIELSGDYCSAACKRLATTNPLGDAAFARTTPAPDAQPTLFGGEEGGTP